MSFAAQGHEPIKERRWTVLFVSTLFVARLNADELPTSIRRVSVEILGTIDPLAVVT